MRSVFFHLVGVSRQAVSEHLTKIASPNGAHQWCWPKQSPAPVLYICFYEVSPAETQPEDVESLQTALGTMPAVSIMVDVSGQVPGDTEVQEFARLMLAEFPGVAGDDFTNHCWTMAEILSNTKIQGHTFFDYKGWWADRRDRPFK